MTKYWECQEDCNVMGMACFMQTKNNKKPTSCDYAEAIEVKEITKEGYLQGEQ